MTSNEWVWDHPTIGDSDYLYRRLKSDSRQHVTMVDPTTLTAKLQPGAFCYDTDTEDNGVSVSIGSVMEDYDMSTDGLVDWSTHSLAFFQVKAIRSECSGIVHTPKPDNPAHGSIRVEATTNAEVRKQWLPIRSRLMEIAMYVAEMSQLGGRPTAPQLIPLS